MYLGWIKAEKPSLVSSASGCLAGLATITPASSYVGPGGAIIICLLSELHVIILVGVVKYFKIDDTLDVLTVYGVGGLLGILLFAPLVSYAFGGLGHSEKSIFGATKYTVNRLYLGIIVV